MRRLLVPLMTLLALLAPQPVLAGQPAVGVVTNFGPNLAAVCPQPEGIAIDPTGNLYAASFAFKPVANICVENRSGQIVDVIPVAAGKAGIASLLGELFEPSQGLYVVDFADGAPTNGRLLRIDVRTHAVTVLATGFQAPNAIAQDRHRNLYVSDSFLGAIFKVSPDGSSNTVWIQDPRLLPQPGGSPPFGANGVAFDRNQRFLYVATTSDSKIYRIPVEKDGSAGAMQLFASGAAIDASQHTSEALHGADGIMFDVRGNLYVCANSAQHPAPGLPGEIQVLSPDAQLIARYDGIGNNDLDFPASLVFHERALYITNLSLDTAGANSKLSVLGVPFPGLPLRP
ncbi:MAG TPA: SMP-30/gluconolactonase/LRE family protein [Candidatus Dormibacteraeota bacterium]|nr:SMP-30/gluconolactonase/LRE family protein [Candidatus Dormibacteraeota bacterium]